MRAAGKQPDVDRQRSCRERASGERPNVPGGSTRGGLSSAAMYGRLPAARSQRHLRRTTFDFSPAELSRQRLPRATSGRSPAARSRRPLLRATSGHSLAARSRRPLRPATFSRWPAAHSTRNLFYWQTVADFINSTAVLARSAPRLSCHPPWPEIGLS